MKNLTFLIPAFFSLSLLSCKKQPVDQLSLLPPATQTGANTFGCLVNGKAFLPKTSGFMAPKPITCFYSVFSGLFLGVSDDYDNKFTSIFIKTDSLALIEGQTVSFKIQAPGNAYAYYNFQNSVYMTNETVSGNLTITKIDLANRIVSGTFNFDGIDTASNEKTKITDGRFDLHYN